MKRTLRVTGLFALILVSSAGAQTQTDHSAGRCEPLDSVVYGYADSGIETDAALAQSVTERLTLNTGQTVHFSVPADRYAYLAYPKRLGRASFFAADLAPVGGWDGAGWPVAAPGSSTGPITISRTIGGVTQDWYLYRTDWPGLGMLRTEITFSVPGRDGAANPVFGYAAAGIDSDAEITAALTGTLPDNGNQVLTLNVPEGKYAYLALPVALGQATFANNLQGGWDGSSWPKGSDYSSNTGPIEIERTVAGVSEDWYLYRTDMRGLGELDLFIHLDRAGYITTCEDATGPAETVTGQPRYWVGPAGLYTGADLAPYATQSLSLTEGQAFTVSTAPDEYVYFAYPAALGLATFTDTSLGLPGGFDGASWPAGEIGSLYGPLVFYQEVSGGLQPWYLYRTDWPGIASLQPKAFQVAFSGEAYPAMPARAQGVIAPDWSSSRPDLVSLDTLGAVSLAPVAYPTLVTLSAGYAGTMQTFALTLGPVDSDYDGLPDAWERQYGLSSTVFDDVARDNDQDRLSVLAEYQRGTNPNRSDTDGDGVSDGFDASPLDAGRTGSAAGEVVVAADLPAYVSLSEVYDQAIVLAAATESEQLLPRFDLVDGTGFSVTVTGPQAAESVGGARAVRYLWMAQGLYHLPDGGTWEVGRLSAETLLQGARQEFQYREGGRRPYLFVTLQSSNGLEPVIARIDQLTATGFSVTQEDLQGQVSLDSEALGYLAIWPGTETAGLAPGSGQIPIGGEDKPYLLRTLKLGTDWQQMLGYRLRLVPEDGTDAASATSTSAKQRKESVHLLALGDKLFVQPVSRRDRFGRVQIQPLTTDTPLEWGTVSGVTEQWLTIPLQKSYIDPVVVAFQGVPSDSTPVVERIRNVTANSFQLRVQEWDYLDGRHSAGETLHYLVVEAGRHSLGGQALQAGTVQAGAEGSSVILSQVMASAPAVLSSVMSDTGAAAVTSRAGQVDAAGFNLGLQGEEAAGVISAAETLGWIALEQGQAVLGGGYALAALTAEIGSEISSVVLPDALDQAGLLTFAGISSWNEADTAQVRLAPTPSALSLQLQEEQSADDERAHASEQVSLVVIGRQAAPAGKILVSSPENDSANALLAPGGGERWWKDSAAIIQWDAPAIAGERVDIYLLNDQSADLFTSEGTALASAINRRHWYPIAAGLQNNGRYDWNPAGFGGAGNNFAVLVVSATDNRSFDISDEPFSLWTSGEGVLPDGGEDLSAQLRGELQALPDAQHCLRLKAGTYRLASDLKLSSPGCIAGEGIGATVLQLSDGAQIKLGRYDRSRFVGLSVAAQRGDSRLWLDPHSPRGGEEGDAAFDMVTLNPGDFLEIESDQEAQTGMSDAEVDARPQWRRYAQGQIVQVAQINHGTGEVLLAQPLNTSYDPAYSRIRKVGMVAGFALKNLTVDGSDNAPHLGKDSLVVTQVADLYVDQVEMTFADQAHLKLHAAYRCQIQGSLFRDAHHFGSGGQGYGVELGRHTSGCRVEDNIFHNLRHAVVLHLGASANIVAYNSAHHSHDDQGGVKASLLFHGDLAAYNLLEGNVAQQIKFDQVYGDSGPGNRVNRNCVTDAGLRVDAQKYPQQITNNRLLYGGQNRLVVGDNDEVNGNLLGDGTRQFSAGGRRSFPASDYLDRAPAFYGDLPFPSLGGDIAHLCTNPAEERHRAMDLSAGSW